LIKNSKFLIFVEGRDDVLFLKICAKTLLNKDLSTDNIALVIGGGSSLSNYADLNLFKEINGEKYAVFVDGDNGDEIKQREKEKIETQCLSDGALFHKLTKREIENFCPAQKIKDCYIDEIKSKEGEHSQNPKIEEISNLSIIIDKNTDVEKHLKNLGLNGFKKGMNIKVFEKMDVSEWSAIDASSEVKNFLEEVYGKI
jgi:hypothetical protein